MGDDEPQLNIFVSSMIGPLWGERAAVEEAIRTGTPLARTWVFERAPASSEEISESYLARVRECDIYLLILGQDISDPVKAEYQTARECDKPRLCFVQEGVERTQALEEFLPTLRADVKYATFSDEASLRREVLRAVRQELVQGYKRYRLGEAERAELVASTPALPPRPPDYFVGRREILDELKAGLATGSTQAIALQGMGGIGKTATAQQLALEIEADFPGGVFWTDLLANQGGPLLVLASWARLCGQDVSALAVPQARAEALRGILAGRVAERGRLLVVLDDVREGWLEGARTLKAALPPGVPLVLTTRDEELACALGTEVRQLDALPMDDALALLSRLAGAEMVEAELPEARALAERVGRLPLALELAGKLATRYVRKPGWRLATLRAQVEGKAAEALKLRGHPGLAATFAVSYEALKEEQQRLFRWLGVFAPGPITVTAVAEVLGDEGKAIEVALDELVGLALVEWGETERGYRLHPLLAEYAGMLLKGTGEARAARGAHLTYYLAYVKANARRDPATYDRLEAKLANLMAAAAWAAEAREHQAVIELGAALYTDSRFLSVRCHYREAVMLSTWSVAAACEIGCRRKEGHWLNALGSAHRGLGQVEQAIEYYSQALEIAREIGDRQGEGAALGNLGSSYIILEQVKEAIKCCIQALEIARGIGDREGEASTLVTLGNACCSLGPVSLGQVEQAIEYYDQALEIAREIGNRQGEGSTLANLGSACYFLGQVEQTIEYYGQAVEIAREIGDRSNEGIILGNLGNACRNLGQMEKAIEYQQQALKIAREIGVRWQEGIILGNLGNIYANVGQVEKARLYWRQSFDILREVKSLEASRMQIRLRFTNTLLGKLAYSLLSKLRVYRWLERASRQPAANWQSWTELVSNYSAAE
jgi:tetratricopeptide (TPR) repeat protein